MASPPTATTAGEGTAAAAEAVTETMPSQAAAQMEASWIPPHELKETKTRRSILIGPWTIEAHSHPISNASQLDDIQSMLGGIPLPEMTFGGNRLVITHTPANWRYTFDTTEALKGVKRGELGEGDGGVKVKHADAWLSTRTDTKTVATKAYDWTYTTTYAGSHPPSIDFTPADPSNPAHTIPMAELTRPDPILFYSHVPLFEDELHDNGSSSVSVRVRVMPGCWFLLTRFVLRVDHVLFRTYDTRIFHSFNSRYVVRERSGWEAPYDLVKQKLPNKHDLTPLTDHNFIATTLGTLNCEKGAETGWRGIGTTLDVAQLPVVADVADKLAELKV